jgi:thioredoxin-related protein
MKFKFLLFLFSAVLIAGESPIPADAWIEDFSAAQLKAKSTGRPMLVNFSGSDWCGWCMKLSDEVFSKPAFKNYAKESLILVLLDFPHNKQQSAALKKQNGELAQKFGIDGFPTVIVLDPNGKTLFQTGYRPGGAEDYVNYLKTMIRQKRAKS